MQGKQCGGDEGAGCSKDEVSAGRPARGGRAACGGDHGDEGAAEVGAQHDPEGRRADENAQGGKAGGEHDGGEAGEGASCERDAGGKGKEARLVDGFKEGAGFGLDRRGCGEDELKRCEDEAESQQHSAELAGTFGRTPQEKHGARENEERTGQTQIERQHAGHQGAAEIGA